MSQKSYQDIALALSGIFQACYLVKEVAHHGTTNQADLMDMIGTLFEFTPKDTRSVYNSTHSLQNGAKLLKKLLSNRKITETEDADVIRYAINVLQLEKHLKKNPDMLQIIGSRLDTIKEATSLQPENFSTLINDVAGLYSETISTLRFRIKVSGHPMYLENDTNAAIVRSLLFAAVRLAILWRQVGGSKWQLLFSRKRLLHEVERVLSSAEDE